VSPSGTATSRRRRDAGADGDVDAVARHVEQAVVGVELDAQPRVLGEQRVDAGSRVQRHRRAGRDAHEPARSPRRSSRSAFERLGEREHLAPWAATDSPSAQRQPVVVRWHQARARSGASYAASARDTCDGGTSPLAARPPKVAQLGDAGEERKSSDRQRERARGGSVAATVVMARAGVAEVQRRLSGRSVSPPARPAHMYTSKPTESLP
jgi:hypothetical protein